MSKKSFLNIIKYVFFSVYTVVITYPIVIVLLSSFKSNEDIYSNPWGLPKVWYPGVYAEVWTRYDIGYYFLNSLFYAVSGCILSLVVCAMGAFAITRLKWKLSKLSLGFLLLGMMVPVHATVVPLYINVRKLGINDPRISLLGIFAAFAIPTTIFILASFMESIPRAMEESAVIDGSSLTRAFFSVILPLTKPALATVAIFNFLSIWNDLLLSLIFISDEKQKTVQLGILRFQGQFSTRYGHMLAAVSIAVIPSILIYIIFQDKIVKGMTAGAIKG